MGEKTVNSKNTQASAASRHRSPAFRISSDVLSLDDALQEFERRYILRLLTLNRGHRGKTAEALGINRKTLYLKLKKYAGLEGREPRNLVP